jgi:pyridoxine 5-phosphate synthase
VVEAARAAVAGGAEGLTVHLREDRRHIQDQDVFDLKNHLNVPLNLEMAAVESVIQIALKVRPAWACLVPEKRQELTTEGGLSFEANPAALRGAVQRLQAANIKVSLFIEPTIDAVRRAGEMGADAVELHTGSYARARALPQIPATAGRQNPKSKIQNEVDRIKAAAEEAARLGLIVNAGHGLTYDNVEDLCRVFPFHEFNIGFAIIARAVFVGLEPAVREMKQKMAAHVCAAS